MVVASDQIGVHLLHLLGHKPELRDAIGIKLMLVAEGNRLQRQDRFARLVHRFDFIFESLRGNDRAEMAAGINNDPDTSSNRYSTNPGDKGFRLSSCRANANRIGVTRSTRVADLDIVVAIEESRPGVKAQCSVITAGRKV